MESKCGICGEPMPPGEEMFNYHGFSGPCPAPRLPSEKPNAAAAIAFLNRASTENCRIVSSGDLTNLQIAEAQASGKFFVDASNGFGWALVPWELTTSKDRAREADYFSRNNMMV